MKTIYALRNESHLFGWAFYTNLKKAVQAAGLGNAEYQAVRRRMKASDDVDYAGQRFVRLELN